jgi:hypothetical protein
VEVLGSRLGGAWHFGVCHGRMAQEREEASINVARRNTITHDPYTDE